MTLDVFGWAADDTGCGWYRLRMPLDQLAAQYGLATATAIDMLRPNTTSSVPQGPDAVDSRIVIGQRVCGGPPSWLWQAMARDNRTLVYEVDDDLENLDESNPNHQFFQIPGVRANYRQNIAVAKRVLCSTEPLAERLREHHSDVRVVGNYVPAWLLEHEHPRRALATIGWAGSWTHAADMTALGRELAGVLARNQQVGVSMMGTDYSDILGLRRGYRLRFTPWSDIETYWRSIDFDIGVIPLADTPFNRAKSAIKAVELAALGIPVIASDTGPYPSVVEHGKTGFLAKSPREFGRYLHELIGDRGLRAEMGAAARERARGWTIEANAWRWHEALKGLMS